MDAVQEMPCRRLMPQGSRRARLCSVPRRQRAGLQMPCGGMSVDRKPHQGGSAFLVSYLSKEHQAYVGIIWSEQTTEELEADFGAEDYR